jgi:hypothetical protein
MQFNPIKHTSTCYYNFSLVKDSSSEKIKLILFLTQKSIKMETKDQDWPYLNKYKEENAAINDPSGKTGCFMGDSHNRILV